MYTPKFELTDESRTITLAKRTVTVHRIRALRSWNHARGRVNTGDLGGWVEREANLEHVGSCWIANYATVRDEARVIDDSWAGDNSIIADHAVLSGKAVTLGRGKLMGRAILRDKASIVDNGIVKGNAIVEGVAIIMERGEVDGHARVSGNTHLRYGKISKNAIVRSNIDHCHIYPVDGHNASFSAWRQASDKICVALGNSRYSLEDFETKALATEPESLRKIYVAAVIYARARLGAFAERGVEA